MINIFGDGDSIRHLWDYPDTWSKLCNYCRLKHVAKFANDHEQVMTLYPHLKSPAYGAYPMREIKESSSSLDVYVHPTTIKIYEGSTGEPATEFIRSYRICELNFVMFSCTCGNLRPQLDKGEIV